jgi:branched-chain amino acid transport system substrate-binding protein
MPDPRGMHHDVIQRNDKRSAVMTRGNGKSLVFLLVAGLSLAAAGCGSSSKSTSSSGSAGLTSGATFNVGYAASLTGRLAIFEQSFLKGLQAQVADINNKGGIGGKVKIVLNVEDAKSDPQTGGVVAQDLISKGAQFLITACDADASIPASQIAEKNQIPVLNSCGSGSALPQEIGKYQFMNVYGTVVEGRAMGQFASQQGYKNACFFTSNDIEYTQSIIAQAQKTFNGLGGKTACMQTFKLDQPQYTSQATAIAAAKPDVVMTSIFLPASVTFLKNLRAAGYTGPVIGDDGDDGVELFGAGSAAKSFYTLTFGFPTQAQTQQFVQVYKAKYGSAPADTVFAALGGDAADLINAAVQGANSTKPPAVRDALANLANVQGATTAITYQGRNGLPQKNVFVIKTNAAGNGFDLVKQFFPSGG